MSAIYSDTLKTLSFSPVVFWLILETSNHFEMKQMQKEYTPLSGLPPSSALKSCTPEENMKKIFGV